MHSRKLRRSSCCDSSKLYANDANTKRERSACKPAQLGAELRTQTASQTVGVSDYKSMRQQGNKQTDE